MHHTLLARFLAAPRLKTAIDHFLTSIQTQIIRNRKITMDHTIALESQKVDIDLTKSHGSWIVDAVTGEEFLDLHGGFGSNALGFNHPTLNNPEFNQLLARVAANKVAHADYRTQEGNAAVREIYERFAKPAGFEQMYFTDGGSMAVAEAVWASIYTKTVDNIHHNIDIKADAVMSLRGAFHGRNGTGASLTNENPKISGHPQLPNFQKVPHPGETKGSLQETLKSIEQYCIDNPHKLAAFIVEDVIQCEVGDRHIPVEFYTELRALADKYGFFVIYDDVQTGFYSAGTPLAYQSTGAPAPDIVVGSKKSGLGYVFAGERALEVKGNAFVAAGIIDSTWFGNSADYIMMAAKLIIIEEENLAKNVKIQGETLLKGLKQLEEEFPEFKLKSRGKGVTLTLEFESPKWCSDFIETAYKNHLIVLGSRNPMVVRLRPNLAITDAEVEAALTKMRQTLQQMSLPKSKL